MEVRRYIEPKLEKGRVVIMVSLDVRGAFDSEWLAGNIKGTARRKVPPKSLHHTGLPKGKGSCYKLNNFYIEIV